MDVFDQFQEEFNKNRVSFLDQYGNPFQIVFGDVIKNPSNEDLLFGNFLLSLIGYDGKNDDKIGLRIIKDIFVNYDTKSFEYFDQELLIKKIPVDELVSHIDTEDLIYKLTIVNEGFFFGGHTYQDWGKYMKEKNAIYRETCIEILKDIIILVCEQWSNIKEVLSNINTESFVVTFKSLKEISFLRNFRSILLFDIYKNLFLSGYAIALSSNIEDYCISESYNNWKTGQKTDFYLLSTPDTITYLSIPNTKFNPISLNFDSSTPDKTTLFIILLEESLCKFKPL